jgi:hypothetical protein
MSLQFCENVIMDVIEFGFLGKLLYHNGQFDSGTVRLALGK